MIAMVQVSYTTLFESILSNFVNMPTKGGTKIGSFLFFQLRRESVSYNGELLFVKKGEQYEHSRTF